MILYLVFFTSDDYDNFDLFVAADSPAEAVTLWRTHYSLPPEAEPERLDIVPTPTGKGAIAWTDITSIVI